MQSRFRCLVALGIWAATAVSLESAETVSTVLTGVAQVDITPDGPVRMYGYASRRTESEGVAGRLRAKALVFGSAAEGPAVLLTVDCGAVPAHIHERVFDRLHEKIDVARDRFVLCNSHCHSGPNLKGLASMEGTDREHIERYAAELTERLVSVVLTAHAERQSAEWSWAAGTVRFAANRRVLKDGKWSGFGAVLDAPVDHSLPLLRIMSAEGKLLALVMNYACHNTTLRGDFMKIHGDWSACAQQAIEADHPGAIAMITIGCGADADPHPHGTVALCEEHGREVAREVKRLMAGSFQPLPATLLANRIVLEMPFAPLPSLDELRRRAGDSYALQHLVKQVERGEPTRASRPFQIVTWAFGDRLAMVFLSDEVVVDYALRLKKELDGGRIWITAYAHDVSNYVASERLIGEGGYEVRNSISSLLSYGRPESIQPSVEEQIIRQVRGMLGGSFQAGR